MQGGFPFSPSIFLAVRQGEGRNMASFAHPLGMVQFLRARQELCV